MIFYLLAFQIACGVFGSVMGERKGMDGQGFAYGFFLGLFGLALVALAPGNRRECPFCRELANPAAVVCPHCRRDIVPTRPLEAEAHFARRRPAADAPPTLDQGGYSVRRPSRRTGDVRCSARAGLNPPRLTRGGTPLRGRSHMRIQLGTAAWTGGMLPVLLTAAGHAAGAQTGALQGSVLPRLPGQSRYRRLCLGAGAGPRGAGEPVGDFVLAHGSAAATAGEPRQLTPVVTVDSAPHYLSPMLRGFEQRRAQHAGGQFVTEMELRKWDNDPLDAAEFNATDTGCGTLLLWTRER